MKRLIDDMDAEEMADYYMSSLGSPKDIFTKLCAPIPEWYDALDPKDDQTWVLCFISDGHPKDRDEICWIGSYVAEDDYPFHVATDRPIGQNIYTYATPVDLNIRYKEDEA